MALKVRNVRASTTRDGNGEGAILADDGGVLALVGFEEALNGIITYAEPWRMVDVGTGVLETQSRLWGVLPLDPLFELQDGDISRG